MLFAPALWFTLPFESCEITHTSGFGWVLRVSETSTPSSRNVNLTGAVVGDGVVLVEPVARHVDDLGDRVDVRLGTIVRVSAPGRRELDPLGVDRDDLVDRARDQGGRGRQGGAVGFVADTVAGVQVVGEREDDRALVEVDGRLARLGLAVEVVRDELGAEAEAVVAGEDDRVAPRRPSGPPMRPFAS